MRRSVVLVHWNEIHPRLWATNTAPTAATDLPALRASLEALLERERASLPIELLFDVTGPVAPFGADVVQGYLQILSRHQDDIRRIYVASDSAVVRFAGSAARFVLGDRLEMVSSVVEAVEHRERATSITNTSRRAGSSR